jgi:hypothetical protein
VRVERLGHRPREPDLDLDALLQPALKGILVAGELRQDGAPVVRRAYPFSARMARSRRVVIGETPKPSSTAPTLTLPLCVPPDHFSLLSEPEVLQVPGTMPEPNVKIEPSGRFDDSVDRLVWSLPTHQGRR